jgi:hypothetical protein
MQDELMTFSNGEIETLLLANLTARGNSIQVCVIAVMSLLSVTLASSVQEFT